MINKKLEFAGWPYKINDNVKEILRLRSMLSRANRRLAHAEADVELYKKDIEIVTKALIEAEKGYVSK